MTTQLTKRYDFVLLFDVQDGNPNGEQRPRITASPASRGRELKRFPWARH
jgi:hypothetical protein